MHKHQVQEGQIVESGSGRDKGRPFIIYQVIDEDYVTVVDGKLRKLEKPKKKKIKHLILKPQVILKLAEKIKEKSTIFDSEIRGALNVFNKKESEGDEV